MSEGAEAVGRIIEEHLADSATVKAKCQGFDGCARSHGFVNFVSVTPKCEFDLWYSDTSLQLHEQCHAWFCEPRHTDAYRGRIGK